MYNPKKSNKYHLISNFPKGSSFFKRVISQLAFLFLVTKLTKRQNYLTEADYFRTLNVIKKGDIILVGGFRSVSGLFLGKNFTHSLLYQGNNKCIHASVDGVAIVELSELFMEYDNLSILRPQIIKDSEKVIEKALNYAQEQLGKPYDFYFEDISDRHYCTLLINTAFSQAGFDTGLKFNNLNKRSFLLARLYNVTKADIFLQGNFQLVFLSSRLKDKKLEITNLKNKFVEA